MGAWSIFQTIIAIFFILLMFSGLTCGGCTSFEVSQIIFIFLAVYYSIYVVFVIYLDTPSAKKHGLIHLWFMVLALPFLDFVLGGYVCRGDICIPRSLIFAPILFIFAIIGTIKWTRNSDFTKERIKQDLTKDHKIKITITILLLSGIMIAIIIPEYKDSQGSYYYNNVRCNGNTISIEEFEESCEKLTGSRLEGYYQDRCYEELENRKAGNPISDSFDKAAGCK